MRVLVIPEDPTLDQYILEPVVERIFRELKRPARVDILRDPHLRGIQQALDRQVITGIIADNPMIDLFLLIVDRDCDRFGNEAKARGCQACHDGKLIVTCAREEVEVWMMALHRGDLPNIVGARWADIQAHCDPKEQYAEPFLAAKGWNGSVGRGRKRAMRNLGQGFRGLLDVCPEIAALMQSISTWLAQRAVERPA